MRHRNEGTRIEAVSRPIDPADAIRIDDLMAQCWFDDGQVYAVEVIEYKRIPHPKGRRATRRERRSNPR
jgi:hypothetical protein